MLRSFLFAGAVSLLPVVAWADAAGDLSQMQSAFGAVKSFHAVESMPDGRQVTVDYVAPDRWRIQPAPNVTEMLIGNDVYMIHNGRTMHVPIPGGMLHRTISAFMTSVPSDVKASARDLGMQMLDGKRVHVYSYTTHGATSTVYVGSDHLPVQSVVKASNGTTTITYSQWNSPAITIEP